MNRILIILSIIFLSQLGVDAQKKFELGLTLGIGYDFQTRSNNYNATGPFYIPALTKSSILHINKPYAYTLKAAWMRNENFGWFLSIGTANRALRYWSLDDSVQPYSYANDKIRLGIRTYHTEVGVRFKGELSSKLNLFWDQTFGVGFGKNSPDFRITKEHSTAELIYLNDKRVGVLVSVDIDVPIISINSSFGVEYKLFKDVFLTVGLKYINEVSNGNNLVLWEYDLNADRITGAYAPYDMEFKTLFSELGIKYRF